MLVYDIGRHCTDSAVPAGLSIMVVCIPGIPLRHPITRNAGARRGPRLRSMPGYFRVVLPHSAYGGLQIMSVLEIRSWNYQNPSWTVAGLGCADETQSEENACTPIRFRSPDHLLHSVS